LCRLRTGEERIKTKKGGGKKEESPASGKKGTNGGKRGLAKGVNRGRKKAQLPHAGGGEGRREKKGVEILWLLEMGTFSKSKKTGIASLVKEKKMKRKGGLVGRLPRGLQQ